jgi:hypothetical protein
VNQLEYLAAKPPSGAKDEIFVTLRNLWILLMWYADSDEKIGLSFTITADTPPHAVLTDSS